MSADRQRVLHGHQHRMDEYVVSLATLHASGPSHLTAEPAALRHRDTVPFGEREFSLPCGGIRMRARSGPVQPLLRKDQPRRDRSRITAPKRNTPTAVSQPDSYVMHVKATTVKRRRPVASSALIPSGLSARKAPRLPHQVVASSSAPPDTGTHRPRCLPNRGSA